MGECDGKIALTLVFLTDKWKRHLPDMLNRARFSACLTAGNTKQFRKTSPWCQDSERSQKLERNSLFSETD